jgi:hypothetical protein
MMTMAHAAAGAAIAHAIRSPVLAMAACVGAHALLDLPRHEDLDHRSEAVLAIATGALTAALFGLRSREFWGGFVCAAPDLEHVLRPNARRLFPTHRYPRLHACLPTPNVSAPTQVAVSGGTLALVTLRDGRG